MSPNPIICVGSACWDWVARTAQPMVLGADEPGAITRQRGGVALNIACALAGLGQNAVLLTHIGEDPLGEALLREATGLGVDCAHVRRSAIPTDSYLAIEAGGALFGAISDCAGLERAGQDILAPLRNGTLAGKGAPWQGTMLVDSNLPKPLLDEIASGLEFRFAHLAFVPAAPGKAARLRDVVKRFGRTVYVNRAEAELICGFALKDARAAARALHRLGGGKAVVTDGAKGAVQIDQSGVMEEVPSLPTTGSVTGAGDAFVAAHLVAERAGADPAQALSEANLVARTHIERHRP